jgi:hypothetical protein
MNSTSSSQSHTPAFSSSHFRAISNGLAGSGGGAEELKPRISGPTPPAGVGSKIVDYAGNGLGSGGGDFLTSGGAFMVMGAGTSAIPMSLNADLSRG